MKLSIVVSVFNEEEVLKEFHKELSGVLNGIDDQAEVIYVNDGSVDDSRAILKEVAAQDKRVKVINFSRNFGHEAAMIAGVDKSTGDCLICMDADLQHPPAQIPKMLSIYKQGFEIITMMRIKNKDSGWFKTVTSRLFYSILNKVSGQKFEVNASDFFLLSKKVANVLKSDFREQSRFLRGFIQMIGFKKTSLEYVAESRFAGESKYSIKHLFKYSFNVMLTFSNLPLKLGVMAGLIVGVFGAFIGIWEIIMKFKGLTPPGYTTIVVLISFLFATLFFIVGIIGEYIAVLFREVKGRPIYIIDEIVAEEDE